LFTSSSNFYFIKVCQSLLSKRKLNLARFFGKQFIKLDMQYIFPRGSVRRAEKVCAPERKIFFRSSLRRKDENSRCAPISIRCKLIYLPTCAAERVEKRVGRDTHAALFSTEFDFGFRLPRKSYYTREKFAEACKKCEHIKYKLIRIF